MSVVAIAAVAWLTVAHRSSPDSGMGPLSSDYVGPGRLIRDAPEPPQLPGASTGSWISRCGRNQNGHRNADNVIVAPGVPGAAGHLHDYVGNQATSAMSSDADLAKAATTCADNDRSTYYWTVLRVIGKGSGPASTPVGMNTGRVLLPDSVQVQFRGNPTSKVIAMPAFLRISTGNAKAVTEAGLNAQHVDWGCSGHPGYHTDHYPRCPAAEHLQRVFDFPSCWDGRRIDSPTHRAQVVFPDSNGTCPAETFAVPQLNVTLTYTVPNGHDFAIDTMMDQWRSPLADHSDFIEVMPTELMDQIVDCVNSGRRC